MLKVLSVIGGLAGAAGLSQYPEFSQQYTQRLAGQIDALSQVVEDFDASALRSGLTRSEALDQMQGTQFLDDRRSDMQRTFLRHEVLTAHFTHLQSASPMQRMMMPHRISDAETLTGTWDDFVPAMPVSLPGAVAAGAGFIAGSTVLGLCLTFLLWPFRRRARAPA